MASDPARDGDKLPRRVPLARSRRRLNFERRIRLWLWLLSLPCLGSCGLLLHKYDVEPFSIGIILFCLVISWAFVVSLFLDEIIRPLQTLSNVVAALRADDYSFRARGGRRNDSIGDLAIELNKLADMLQAQRVGALEAQALVDRVMSAIQSPVIAFDTQGKLRLFNMAAEKVFRLHRRSSMGKTAQQLELDELIQTHGTHTEVQQRRWIIERGTFRLNGVPHSLFVLSDISVALQQEERVAWERIVRVLGHEINNSLAPIKSIAGSLLQRIPSGLEIDSDVKEDFHSGLSVIEDRADSLNRFLQSYRQLLKLPAPTFHLIPIGPVIKRIAQLETRLSVTVMSGPDVSVSIDEDQIQQALINLVRNAVEAAQSISTQESPVPKVEIFWESEDGAVAVSIVDNGPGLTNAGNLFVPFYTTKESGSGIGLVLAQQIAHAHRGAIKLSNREDGTQGCRAELRISLPR